MSFTWWFLKNTLSISSSLPYFVLRGLYCLISLAFHHFLAPYSLGQPLLLRLHNPQIQRATCYIRTNLENKIFNGGLYFSLKIKASLQLELSIFGNRKMLIRKLTLFLATKISTLYIFLNVIRNPCFRSSNTEVYFSLYHILVVFWSWSLRAHHLIITILYQFFMIKRGVIFSNSPSSHPHQKVIIIIII